MTKFWKHKIPNRPLVWWYVQGRKHFAVNHGAATRRMWGCGNYHNTI